MEKREKAIQLGKDITEARERLQALERELDALLGGGDVTKTTAPVPPTPTVPPMLRFLSTAAMVEELLASADAPLSTRDIFAALRQRGVTVGANSILALLSRLASEGRITRVDRGLYRKAG